MQEKTAIWKHDSVMGESYLEFDFLAILTERKKINFTNPWLCGMQVSKLPVNQVPFKQNYGDLIARIPTNHLGKRRTIIDNVFLQELTRCVAASCDCLTVNYGREFQSAAKYAEFLFQYREGKSGCEMCIIDKPTGSLRVSTSVKIDKLQEDGPANCSLILHWTSKAKSLQTRDSLSLPKHRRMSNVTVYIDFLPAIEVLRAKQAHLNTSASLAPMIIGYEHDSFLVPKRCHGCGGDTTWRRSDCLAEISDIHQLSSKHRKCFQIAKYLNTQIYGCSVMKSYHIKIHVISHSRTCADTSECCADCVLDVFKNLQRTYDTLSLRSYSKARLLYFDEFKLKTYDPYPNGIEKLCSVSNKDTLYSFIKKVKQ